MSDKESQVVSLRSEEIIDNEAAGWLTKLDRGNVSAGDRRALKLWLSQAPEHAQALDKLAAMWSEMDFLLNGIPETNKRNVPNPFLLLMPSRKMTYALSVFVICTVSLFFWQGPEPVATETSFHSTRIGTHRLEQFSDGSSAHLNTNSIIETEFSNFARIVRLLRGEALFDVTHDPDRPFIVYAGNRVVKAIGTKFVVRLDSENIVLTVTDGQVQLSKRQKGDGPAPKSQEQEIILVSKGERVEVNDEVATPKPEVIQNNDLERQLSWVSGQLVFENERLEQVIEEVSRYVPDRIIIDDPELLDTRISGRLKIGDTDALLEAIEVSFNVQADHTGDRAIHLSPETPDK
jgi:transmembrane sensor